jgi:hypothetical protein
LFEELKENVRENARHFVDFPEVIFFDDFADHIEDLFGAEITRFEVDGTLEMWLEFTFRGNRFFVNNKFGDYQFFVEDKNCPEIVLLEIAEHFRRLLESDEPAIQEFDENEM